LRLCIRRTAVSQSFQSYEPYRRSLLPKEELKELQSLHSWRVVCDTGLGWLGIIAGFVLVKAIPEWYAVALAIPLIGTRYYSLLIVGHDGLHRRLFDSPRKSDLWNDLFILGPIGAITRLNRVNHMRHHGHLATAQDPDRYKYAGANKPSRLKLVLVLTGLPYVGRALRNVFLPPAADVARSEGAAPTRSEGYRARDLAILLGWQAALIGGLSWWIGWWAYPVLWLVPVYCFGFVADIVRVFCEHSAMEGDDVADRSLRLVSFSSNVVERQFFSPHNMNCHIAHHLWPAIPYYNLPDAERRIRRALGDRPTALAWRPSYVRHIADYWRWRGQVHRPTEGAPAP
jgi:fatty acid desaturase